MTEMQVYEVKVDSEVIGHFFRGNPLPKGTIVEDAPFVQMAYSGSIPGVNNDKPVYMEWNSSFCGYRIPFNGDWDDMRSFDLGNMRQDNFLEVPFPSKALAKKGI